MSAWFGLGLPSLLVQSEGLRRVLFVIGFGIWFADSMTGLVMGAAGRRRGFRERAAGYATVSGVTPSWITLGPYSAPSAWSAF